MNPPYVAAVVQVRPPSSGARFVEWFAAIVTAVRSDRKQLTSGGWIDAVDVVIFRPQGGILPARMVGRWREAGGEDEQPDEYVWRWPQERGQ